MTSTVRAWLRPTRRPALVAFAVVPLLVIAAVAAVAAVTLVRAGDSSGDGNVTGAAPGPRSDTPVLDPDVVERDAAALVQRTLVDLPTDRLAPGVLPPTNRWYSGLAFGATPQPVFAVPLGIALRDDGFAFGVPRVESSERAVVGSAPTDVSVSVAGMATGVVTGDDDLTVTVELRDDGPLAGPTDAMVDFLRKIGVR